jgi:hypothetical protein
MRERRRRRRGLLHSVGVLPLTGQSLLLSKRRLHAQQHYGGDPDRKVIMYAYTV